MVFCKLFINFCGQHNLIKINAMKTNSFSTLTVHFKLFAMLFIFILVAGSCEEPNDIDESQSNQSTTSTAAKIPVPQYPGTAAFVTNITNPYLNFDIGRVFNYESDDGEETITIEVTGDTKIVMGVTTTVVREKAFKQGQLVEDTFDWFAQDTDGNVWYFGEDSKEIENGAVVSTEGSWEAGVDGAEPGILMLATPQIGMQYRQEYYEGEAEDEAKVLSLSESVDVPFGSFKQVLETMEWSQLEPGAREHKYYKQGVGLLLEEAHAGGGERVELISIQN